MDWMDEIAARWRAKNQEHVGNGLTGYMSSYSVTDNPDITIPGVPESRQVGQGLNRFGKFTEVYTLSDGRLIFYDPQNGGTILGRVDENGRMVPVHSIDLGNSGQRH